MREEANTVPQALEPPARGLRVGDLVRFHFATTDVLATVIEDRGPLAGGGRRLLRLRLDPKYEVFGHEIEMPEEELRASPALRLGIRSVANCAGEGMEKRADRFLDLGESFSGRCIRDQALWQETVLPQVREFLARAAVEGRPLHLELVAHPSIAFAAGYCLEARSGLDVAVLQRGRNGSREWLSHEGTPPEGPLWCSGDDVAVLDGGRDVALAASVSRSVLADVEVCVRESGLPVGRIMPVSLLPGPSFSGIVNGAHAWCLAQELKDKIRSRSAEERRGVLHLFVSGPNVFLFFLGQLGRSFGRVRLYEHTFGSGEAGTYRPSMRFPPPDQEP